MSSRSSLAVTVRSFLEYLRETAGKLRATTVARSTNVVVNVMRQQAAQSQSEISPERIEDFYVRKQDPLLPTRGDAPAADHSLSNRRRRYRCHSDRLPIK